MGDISENISQIQRRGRPPLYTHTSMALASRTFVEVFTKRGQQNKVHLLRAHVVLKDELGLEWLIDKAGIMQRKPGAYRQTILQELGRIEDDDTLKAVARQLCELKPTAREAVAMIRHFRLDQQPMGHADDLTKRLIALINGYIGAHAGVDKAMILEALTRTVQGVETSLGGDQ